MLRDDPLMFRQRMYDELRCEDESVYEHESICQDLLSGLCVESFSGITACLTC